MAVTDTVDLILDPTALGELPAERLEAEICTRAGHLAAMECAWLLMVGEFDRRELFNSWEARSTAHWLTWKCALGSRAAHEKVRVARRLDELPLITNAFSHGELSYSKVRALTRIATDRTEEDLLNIALYATGAQVERLVAGRRQVERQETDEQNMRNDEPGYTVRWHHDEHGALIINARLEPETGAIVTKALEAAINHERNRTPADTDDTDDEKCSAEHSTFQRCDRDDCPGRETAAIAADALVSMADSYLAAPDQIRSGTDRYATLVIVEEAGLTGADPHARATTAHGAHLEPDTARRLACDSAVQPIIRRADGTILDAGHTTRTPNRATRRALTIRDGGCVFPGCGRTRWVDAHHIIHWANNGPTNVDNLILLCRHHHRAVHEGGYTIHGIPQHAPVEFRRPDGNPVDPHCEHTTTHARDTHAWLESLDTANIGPDTIPGNFCGDPLPLGDAIAGLLYKERPEHRDYKVAGTVPFRRGGHNPPSS